MAFSQERQKNLIFLDLKVSEGDLSFQRYKSKKTFSSCRLYMRLVGLLADPLLRDHFRSLV